MSKPTILGEWRIVHTRREEHFELPLWCVDRINADGTEWIEAAVFDTKAAALSYIKERNSQ